MNVVTFNTDFEEFFARIWQVDLAGKARERYVKAALTSPLFQHTDDIGGWKKTDYEHCFDGELPITPFPAFRLNAVVPCRLTKGGTLTMTADFIVAHNPDNAALLHYYAIFRKFKHSDGRTLEPKTIVFDMALFNDINQIFGVAYSMDGEVFQTALDLVEEFRVGDEVWMPGTPGETDFQPAQVIEQTVAKFCIDCMNPSLHMIRTHPSARGRSVEWLQPRTHYILLHKARVEHVRRAKSGVQEATNEVSIQRISHARRAHDRYLRSAKFKNKQGQTIRVREAWIGPKEWEDKSGQIYKFIERPNVVINHEIKSKVASNDPVRVQADGILRPGESPPVY